MLEDQTARLGKQEEVKRPIPATAELGSPPCEGAKDKAQALTPAEQMALFEKELKETDWGHQPC
jgi:hypothetical protein